MKGVMPSCRLVQPSGCYCRHRRQRLHRRCCVSSFVASQPVLLLNRAQCLLLLLLMLLCLLTFILVVVFARHASLPAYPALCSAHLNNNSWNSNYHTDETVTVSNGAISETIFEPVSAAASTPAGVQSEDPSQGCGNSSKTVTMYYRMLRTSAWQEATARLL